MNDIQGLFPVRFKKRKRQEMDNKFLVLYLIRKMLS